MEHLTDAPVANILILAGIIFVAVGLFGHIGGFIGSIFGSIEAGKKARVLSGVLGVALIVGGGWMHEQADKQAAVPNPSANSTAAGAPAAAPAQPAAGSGLEGTWLNTADNGRNGLHKLEIRQAGSDLQVHAWGTCIPKDCDWGMQEAPLSGSAATVTWSLAHGQRQAAVTVGPVESGQLKVAIHNTLADGRTNQFSFSFVKAQ
ncbi:MAG: hypothetical protein ACRD3T_14895 [Terriglobia bacterium]